MANVETVGHRLFVERMAPASTCETLLDLVKRAREQTKHDGMVVLFIDPIQRLFAHEQGALKGSGLDRMNADEPNRVGVVAQQLIAMLEQDKRLAVLFTSDTTKGAAANGVNSATDLRGSYMLNHAASTILGLDTCTLEELNQQATGSNASAKTADRVDAQNRRLDERMLGRNDAVKLGARVATVECSGNRRGPGDAMAFTFVPGAMCFTERPGLNLDDEAPLPSDKRKPEPAGKGKSKGGSR
jgi:hypothetical protein